MDWKFLNFIGIFVGILKDFGVISCQPPPYGLYNNYNPAASNQFSYNQLPNPAPSTPPVNSQTFQQNFINHQLSETSTQFSFLQDNSIDDPNSFPNNPVVRSQSPPSDPPTNPFLISESKTEQVSESQNNAQDLEKLVKECSKNGVETLENFRKCTESYVYGLTPEHAQFGSDKCDFEPEFVCRFYSDSSELLAFKSGQFRISPKENRIFQETFAILTNRPVNNIPNQAFIFVDVPFGIPENSVAILKTDILCQKNDGKLSFDYWTTKSDITLKVCTRTDRERSCTQDITYDTESSRVEIDVIHPTENKFVLEIVVSNFLKPSVFILDNLEYEAEMCEDPFFATQKPVITTTTSQFVQSRNALAYGSNIKPNSFPIQNENFQPLQSAEYVRPPKNQFQNWQFSSGQQSAQNQFSPINQPSVFPEQSFPSEPPHPTQAVLKQKIVPPVDQSTNVNSKNNDGVLFVQNRYSQSPKQNVISKGIKKVSSCELVQCNFETNFCKWFQPQMSSEGVRYGKWQISRSQVGNPLTGIKTNLNDHGGFAFVGMDHHSAKVKGRTVFILESPSFTLDADTLLSFDLYRRSNAITLQICLDSLLNCPYEAPPLQTLTYWKEGESLIMPKNTRKIYFVATQWKRFKWLAIDNIVINKGRGCHGLEATKKRPR